MILLPRGEANFLISSWAWPGAYTSRRRRPDMPGIIQNPGKTGMAARPTKARIMKKRLG
jgi:hypothetical protein